MVKVQDILKTTKNNVINYFMPRRKIEHDNFSNLLLLVFSMPVTLIMTSSTIVLAETLYVLV